MHHWQVKLELSICKTVFYMIESLEPALYHSISLIQAFQLTSIVHQKVLRVFYSYLHKKGVPLNLHEIPKNFTTLR